MLSSYLTSPDSKVSWSRCKLKGSQVVTETTWPAFTLKQPSLNLKVTSEMKP